MDSRDDTLPKVLRLRWLFFFQAEDGIRDYKVTGVQTCALPISPQAGEVRNAVEAAEFGVDVDVVGDHGLLQPARLELLQLGEHAPGVLQVPAHVDRKSVG